MFPRFKALINPYKRKNKNDEYSIMIRVTLGRHVKYFNTRLKIRPRYWKGDEPFFIRENHPQASYLNAIIKQKKDMLYEYSCRLHFMKKPISMNGLVEFHNKRGNPNSFVDFVKHHVFKNPDFKRNYNTWKKYKTFYELINNYNQHLQIGDLEEAEFQRYIKWRREVYQVSNATILKDFDCFKKLVKVAIKEGYLDSNPFEYVTLDLKKTSRNRKDYLDVDEINKIGNIDLSDDPDLDVVRRLFLFCTYSCMYYSNLRSLEWSELVKGPSGYCIEAKRTKNDLPFVVPIYIYPNAIKIIEGQKGKHKKKVFPDAPSEQHFNRRLKDIAEAAGIDKKISNKFARKTGATFLSSMGLETHFLKQIMGHTKESTTHEYLYIAAKEVSSRVDQLDLKQIDF